MIIPGMSGMFKLKEHKSSPEDRAKNSRKLYDSALKVVEEIASLEPGEQDAVLELVKVFLNDDRGRSMGQTMDSMSDQFTGPLMSIIGHHAAEDKASPEWVKKMIDDEKECE